VRVGSRRSIDTTGKFAAHLHADTEARNKSGQTSLMMAVQAGDEATVKVLVARCADIEAEDGSGETPLTWARKCEDDNYMYKLLQRGRTTV
jgi:ankyrin repeat protein